MFTSGDMKHKAMVYAVAKSLLFVFTSITLMIAYEHKGFFTRWLFTFILSLILVLQLFI